MGNSQIRLGHAHEFVELRVLEHGTVAGHSEGDVRIGVAVQFDEFSGRYNGVWISKADWAAFVSSLLQLELTRKGSASLVSMSPDEFELQLQIIDQAGHLDAHGHLARYHWHQQSPAMRSRIEYRVGVDPSLLKGIAQWFADAGAADEATSRNIYE